MKECPKFKKGRDIVETNPDLSFDFKGSVRNGIVTDNCSRAFYNSIENGADVGPVLRDKFDFIQYDHSYRTYRKSKLDEKNKSNE